MSCENMNAVGWFEIPVTDMPRAKRFYQAVLKTQFEDSEMNGMHLATFPMKKDEGGAAGALVEGRGLTPSTQGTVVYFVTESIEEATKIAEKNGAKILLPKTAIGEYGFIAQLTDSEGNKIALHCMK